MGISASTAESLRQYGHDVVHVGDEGLHSLADEQILAKARDERRVVLTFDLDFGDLLAAGSRMLPSVVICRLQNHKPTVVTAKLLTVLSERSRELDEGAILIVEEARYRVRRLPID